MRHRCYTVLYVALIVTLVAAIPACKKKAVETVPAEPDRTETPRQPAEAPTEPMPTEPFPTEKPDTREMEDADAAEINRQGVLKPIYFQYDQYDLSADARQTIQQNADWIEDHARFKVVIEGHCDERGSIEYNLALGQKRADTVRDYLTTLGIPSSRLRVVSYGEERPAATGHSESAFSQNRRAAFLVE